MARIRTIKPEFWSDEALSAQPEATHLLAAGLLNYSDDDGYFNANVQLIRAACSPLREPSVSIDESLKRLSSIGYIQLGSVPDGRMFGKVVNFLKHQVVNRPTPSKIKALAISWNDHGIITEPSSLEGKGKEQGTGKGKEGSAADAADRDELDGLRDWLTWWNTLKNRSLVPHGVSVEEPSQGVLRGWNRFRRDASLRRLLSDRDAIEREIHASTFCRETWFRLEKLFGGTNRDGELIARKLLDGAYRDKAGDSFDLGSLG